MTEKNCHRTGSARKSKCGSLHMESAYDDGNIPETDTNTFTTAEPLPESTRPRQDGPGGN